MRHFSLAIIGSGSGNVLVPEDPAQGPVALIEGDLLLVAAGRQPNTDDLGLDAAGVSLREDGRIQVDQYGRTAAAGIWSLGDASSPFQLKHVANAEARTLAHNLAHPGDLRPFPPTAGPCGTPRAAARCTPTRPRESSSAPTSWATRPRC